MTEPITIEALKIEGFRAYLQPQIVNLHRGKTPLSLAVFAPNAKGKSSLVDAFEYYFSKEATLKRLGKIAAQTNAGRLAMEHVAAEENDLTPAVHFWFRQGNAKFDAVRRVSTAETPLPQEAERLLSLTKLPFIIRGHELRGFVETTTPEERYKEIVSWFGLDPFLAIQRNLRKLCRAIKRKAESKDEITERLHDLKQKTNDVIRDWDETKVCDWVNVNVLTNFGKPIELSELSASDGGYQELARRKASEDEQVGLTTLKRLLAHIEALFKPTGDEGGDPKGKIDAFEKAVALHASAIAREAAERKKASQAVFSDVWKAAQSLFANKEAVFDTCPVCDVAFQSSAHGSRANVFVSLKAKLDDLAEYQKAESEKEQAAKALGLAADDLRQSLETTITSLEDAGYDAKAHCIFAYLPEVEKWHAGDETPVSTEVVAELNHLFEKIAAEKNQIEQQQGEHTYANALKIVDSLFQIKADLERIQRTKEELRTLRTGLEKQASAINRAIVSHTQSLISRLQRDVDNLYKEIQGGGESAPPIRFELPDEAAKNQQCTNLFIDFADNRKGVIPTGYLSDSQIHTLALALRLSAIRSFNTLVPIIVLDDVVTSYDADHRKNIAAVFAKYFGDFQIVLVTHDEQFFNLLQDHLSPAKFAFRRITKLDPNFGPNFHDHRTPNESIRAKLDGGESAAAEMRQAEEEWLLDICRGFGVKVVIRPVHRPYQFERSELAGALATFLKKINTVPPDVPGISNAFLSSLQRGVVENFASHFSDDPHRAASVGDEVTRWKEFEYFRDMFVCPACGRRRFKRPQSLTKPVCIKCETQFSFSALAP